MIPSDVIDTSAHSTHVNDASCTAMGQWAFCLTRGRTFVVNYTLLYTDKEREREKEKTRHACVRDD